MKDDTRMIALDPVEQGVAITALNELRNDKLRENRPTRDIEDLLLKIIDAPARKHRSRNDEAR